MTDADQKKHRWDWLDRHATAATVICVAILVLLPSTLAVIGIHGNRTSIDRINEERTVRIYSQNAADKYVCGRLEKLEELDRKVLKASLLAHMAEFEAGELNGAEVEARELNEKEIESLENAGKCEVLIPPPPHTEGSG